MVGQMGVKPASFIMANIGVGLAAVISGFFLDTGDSPMAVLHACAFFGAYFYYYDADYLEKRFVLTMILEAVYAIAAWRVIDHYNLSNKRYGLIFGIVAWTLIYVFVKLDKKLTNSFDNENAA